MVKKMDKKKIIICIAVFLLVAIIYFSFGYFFTFEKDKEENEIPDVTEALVEKLYSYLPENPLSLYGMYSYTYTTINNISNDLIQATIYEYILNYDEFQLEVTSLTEMQSYNISLESGEVTPLYKIKLDLCEEVFYSLFGSNSTYQIKDFRYDYNTLIKTDSNKEYYFVYNNSLETSENNIVFRDIIQYEVTDNKETIEIYDYYLKCDLNTLDCYNDERKSNLNSTVKYSEDLDITNYISSLTKYKHTFKYENGYYYWYSSETV